MTIHIHKAGLQTTVQSRPRKGLRDRGIPAAGAADPLALALANRLLGNRWDAPSLELTLIGPSLQFDSPVALAMTGAEVDAKLDGSKVPMHETILAKKDSVLDVGSTSNGARAYIAFAGGLAIAETMGSASTYLQAGFGGFEGRALVDGDNLPCESREADFVRTPDEFRPVLSNSFALRTCASGETEALSAESHRCFFESNWNVGKRFDRMGMQLEGASLAIRSDGRMASAAVFPGTIQCPENGAPYLLSVDAGTIGGYPRIAQVSRVDRHLLGQPGPGAHLRFLYREPDDAVRELVEKQAYWRRWLPDVDDVI